MLLAGVSTARANSIALFTNSYSYGSGGEYGGEFTAHTSPNNFLSNYAPVAIVNGGFETFCVQPNVYYYPGTTYTYTLSNWDSAGKALSLGAAFLYYEFATGTLAGYDYLNNGAVSRNTDAGELQVAFWELQGQTVPSAFQSLVSGDPFYTLALTDLGGLTNALSANNGTYAVDILQLHCANGAPAQNQLVLVTPEPGATTTMLAFACGALVLLRRHIRRYHGLARS